MKNLLTNVPTELPEELVERLLDASSVRIERIISRGTRPPRDSGTTKMNMNGSWCFAVPPLCFSKEISQPLEMREGDCLTIPAHTRHRVHWTTPDEPTIWLAIHYTD